MCSILIDKTQSENKYSIRYNLMASTSTLFLYMHTLFLKVEKRNVNQSTAPYFFYLG